MLNEKCQQKSETESETANFRTELNLFSTTHFHNEKTLSPDNCPPEKNSTCLLCLNEERLFGSQSETLMPKSNEEQLPKSIRVQQSSVVNLVEAVAEKINELEEHMRKEERKSRILAEEKQKKEEVARAIQERLLREELQLSGESSKTQTDWSSNSPELGTLTLEDEEDSKMVTGLMKAGALKFEDRPLWYDVYSAFPPKYEPRFDRLPIKAEVKSIVYPEDIVRARFYQKYGSSKSTIFDLFNEKTKPIAEMFVEKFYALSNDESCGKSFNACFENAAKFIASEGISLESRDGRRQGAQEDVGEYNSREKLPVENIDVSKILN